VIHQFTQEFLFQICAPRTELRQPINDVNREVKSVDVIQHGHFKWRRDRAFLLVFAHVKIIVIRSAVGQAMNQPGMPMITRQ
jgi:hypothetical protein